MAHVLIMVPRICCGYIDAHILCVDVFVWYGWCVYGVVTIVCSVCVGSYPYVYIWRCNYFVVYTSIWMRGPTYSLSLIF